MTSITISTETVTKSLLIEVASLYAAEHYKTLLWEWQFAPRFGHEVKCIVARENGTVIGFNATMPVLLIDDHDRLNNAIWSCDFIVAPGYRGKGIGQAIKDEMARSFKLPIMSLGISDSAFPLLLKKGWVSPARLQVWGLLLRPRTFKQLLLLIWSKIFRACHFFDIKRANKKLYAEEIDGLPQPIVIEKLWKLHREKEKSVEVLRNFFYLKWRYLDCPFSVYRFLHVGSSFEGPKALIIFRITSSNNIEVVDFIGVKLPEVISAAITFLLKRYPDLFSIHWNNSIPGLRRGLMVNGFVKKSYTSRFATHSDYDQPNWCLVAGDSDGDFLRVAKENYNLVNSNVNNIEKADVSDIRTLGLPGEIVHVCGNGFVFRRLDENEFLSSELVWTELINKSDANPLFMGWRWVANWWGLWGKLLSLDLHIIFIFNKEQLVGILPLYRYKRGIGGYYQFIGNAWGISPTVRSEYTSPIFCSSEQKLLYQSLKTFIKKSGFNNSFIFSDTVANHMPNLCYWEHRNAVGYKTKVTGFFDDYVVSLGRMTRLKAFNRRMYLHERYKDMTFSVIDVTADSIDVFFNHLNSFHLLRWGKPCFDSRAVQFHSRLLLGPLGKGAILSYLIVDGGIVSASYNLKQEGVVYNIQSGYLEEFDKKVSLGTLHMGWLLEQAFADGKVFYFDFLAGFGRSEDYKKHYRGEVINFLTLQYFSNCFFGFLFCSVFWVKRVAKRCFSTIGSIWE